MLQVRTESATLHRQTPAATRTGRRAHQFRTVVSFDLTVPGLTSAAPRQALMRAFGDAVRAIVSTTNRRRDAITLRVEVTDRSLDDILATLASSLDQATIGRTSAIAVPR